jgi:hypothetical protein
VNLTLPYTSLDLDQTLTKGELNLERQHQAKEAEVRGNLRGGNAGCVVDGEVVGGCHRHAIARALGLDLPPDADSRRFFEAGRATEVLVSKYLAAGHKGEVREEEEAAIKLTLDSGRLVTGRPDFLLFGKDGEKVSGIELKALASYNGAARVWYEHTPDPKHLTQALLYCWQHNCPWTLLYVSVAQYTADFRDVKRFGLPKWSKLAPFRKPFYLRLEQGRLVYQHPVTGDDVQTIFTVEGVRQYYELVDECLATKQLYLAPKNKAATGEDWPWEHERYCEYCQTATEVEGNWDLWVAKLQELKDGDSEAA